MDWIKNLKAGDTVIIEGSYGVVSVEKVLKITPTGKIVVGDETKKETFSRGGWGGGDIWHRRNIVEATPERMEAIRRGNIIHKITTRATKSHLGTLPTETLLAILELVGKPKPKEATGA